MRTMATARGKKLQGLGRMVGIVVFCLAASAAALAQIGTPGTFVGTVRDASNAVLPGATVTATNISTGVVQQATADTAGRYRIPLLPPGQYRLEAAAQGFRSEVHNGIELTVARTQELDFTLTVGAVSESVNVTGEAPLVDTAASSVSALVSGSEVRDLPLNGRSFDQLISLSPGTVRNGRGLTALQGTTILFSVAGSRPSAGKLIVDGSELSGGGDINTVLSTASGNLLGVEAIQEFAVITNNGDASYGKKSGGQVNVVTRSGTNQLHGSAFEFLRNEIFDARNFFDAEGAPPLRQNNYGVAVGGPIKHDKTFFFSNLEEYRERRTTTLVAPVPSLALRQGLLPDGSRVTINPGVQPILNLYPLPSPNGRDFGDGTAQAITAAGGVVNDNYILGRVDHNFSAASSLFGRYLIQTGNRVVPDDNGLGQFPETNPFRTQLVTSGYKRTFSPNLVNQTTFAFNKSHFQVNYIARAGLTVPPEMIFIKGQNLQGGVGIATSAQNTGQIPVIGGQGTVGTQGRYFFRSTFEYSDQVNYSQGAHFLQFGGQLQRMYITEFEGTKAFGFLQFPDLRNFLLGIPNQFQGPQPGSDAVRDWRQFYTGIYAQDSYRVKPTLTLNVGMRWEFLSNPIDDKGRTAAFVPAGNQTSGVYPDGPTITKRAFGENHSGNFAPRFGFAWNVFGSGKTSVRGGFGMFYGQLEQEYRRALGASPPFYTQVTVTNPPFPNPSQVLAAGALGKLSPLGLFQAPDIPTTLQYNLTIEQQIAPQTVVKIGYVGSHSYHLARDTNPQVPIPVLNAAGRLSLAQTPRNPNLTGNAAFIVWDANSTYNSLQVELDKRMAHGLQFHSAFTWSKAIDESAEVQSANTGVAANTILATNHRFDRALAGYNLGRRFVANWSYDLPLGNHKGFLGVAANSWQLSGILQMQDGLPFSVFDGVARSFTPNTASQATDRPDYNPAHTGPVVLGGPNRYYDPTTFILQPLGVIGNVGAATLIGPGQVTLDAILAKNFRITERFRFQFRAEAFNLLNRANFSLPSTQLFTATGQRIGAAGVIQATTTTSRELQMALKFIF
jgi:carboxypeptidase family protein/TonB-dependent receptor-like protein